MERLFKAFSSSHFDTVYSRFATAHWASTATKLDVPSIHSEVRLGIFEVIKAARKDGDPGSRVFLVKGGAGLGKTHCLSTELSRAARSGSAFPVLTQLAVDISPDELSRWLLKKVFDELSSSSFPDEEGRTPLRRLATELWSHAPEQASIFEAKVENGEDEESVDRVAAEASLRIVRALRERGVTSNDREVIAGLLARAEEFGTAFKAWINLSSAVQHFGGLSLEPLEREDERKEKLVSLARVCRACGAPLILAIDQIEATKGIGSADLLNRFVSYAIQLVDDSILGTGVIICALYDTSEEVLQLPASLRQRLELGPKPAVMRAPKVDQLKKILERRAALLLERAEIAGDRSVATEAFSPVWLLTGETMMPRDVLDVVRRYRERCIAEGRFVTEPEYRTEGPDPDEVPEPPPQDFDKLWQDRRDQAVGGVRAFSDQQRLELLEWLLTSSARENPDVDAVRVSHHDVEGDEPARVVRAEFLVNGTQCLEAWEIAYADAPVQRGRLLRQINAFLENCTDAKPAVVRVGSLTGFEGDAPDRPLSALARLKTGPALVALIEHGGRVAPTESRHWEELANARAFVGEFADASGFEAWCIERRFLTNEIEVGPLATLAVPEGNIEGQQPRNDDFVSRAERLSTDEAEATEVVDDARDRARILIGSSGGEEVHWDLDRSASPPLPNFGLTVSGDAGQGKTQIIKAILAEAAQHGCPILVFDFKNDYTGAFSASHEFRVLDLQDGLPFNPLRPPPQGPSGCQIMRHVYELTAVLSETLGLGAQQAALLRNSIASAFERRGQRLDEWVDPAAVTSPSLSEAIGIAEQEGSATGTSLINRLGLLHGMAMLPDDAGATVTFEELMGGQFVLSFNNLPNDDKLKAALAEMVLIQTQGYMLRGEQPRALRRVLVFDEAWRASQSDRLIQLAREGRAFGVAVVVGTQFPDDLSPDLVGNLATKLYLYNSDAKRRSRIVSALVGKTSGKEAVALSESLGSLQQFEGLFANQQYSPYTKLRITPHFERF